MTRLKTWFGIAAFSLLVLSIPSVASAQWRDNDRYGNNNGYGNRQVIRDIKNRTRELQRQIDRELDRGRYNGSNREDNINNTAAEFRNAVDRLDNNGRDSDSEMRNVIQLGSRLDRQISRSGLSYGVKNQMSIIRQNLQQLGYGYYNDRNNRNNRNRNGGWNNGGWNNGSRPAWWPF